jgi:PKD repeat protein
MIKAMRTQVSRAPGRLLAFVLLLGLFGGLLWTNPVAVAAAAPAVLAQQGGSSTIIQPLESAVSAENFYSYSNWQAHTGLEEANHSLLFFHYDTSTGQLALIMIHSGIKGDLGGARFTFTGLPTSSTLALRDDPNDTYNFAPPNADFLWFWDAGYTDGAVIDTLSGQFAITIQPIFKKGITEWDLLSAEPDGSVRTIPLASLTKPLALSLGAGGPAIGGQGPLASFTFSPSAPQIFVPVLFDAGGSQAMGGSRIVRYQWDFNGHGQYEESTDQPQITHLFQSGGTIRVGLQVTDSAGLQGRTSQTLVITTQQTSAIRTISTPEALPLLIFRVTVELQILTPSNGLGLEEQWPAGWTIIAVKNDGAAFKDRLGQWVFPSFLPAGTTKEIIYDVQVPEVTRLELRSLPALATVKGSVSSVAPGYRVPVTGDDQVTIVSCLSTSVAVSHLDLASGDIDLRMGQLIAAGQVQRVIQLWQNSKELPHSCAGALSLDNLTEVVRRQLLAIPVGQPIPTPAGGSGTSPPTMVTRVILTPLPFHQLDRLIDGGRTFRVELDIKANQDLYGLGIRERIPDGWQLEPVAQPGAAFNRSSVEWLFSDVITAGQFRTIIYQATAPADQSTGSYLLKGTAIVAPSGAILNPIRGDSQVDLVECLSVPVAISHLNTKTGLIDLTLSNVIQLDQVQAAINLWFDDAVVPGTCGVQLDVATLQQLIDLSLSGKPIDKQ